MLGCSSWEPEKRAGAGQEVKGGVCVRAGRGLWGRGLGRGLGGRGAGGVCARRGITPNGRDGPQGMGREVSLPLRGIVEGWCHLWAGGQNRSGLGISSAPEAETLSSAPGHPATAQSPSPKPLPSPSGCSLPRAALPAPPSC